MTNQRLEQKMKLKLLFIAIAITISISHKTYTMEEKSDHSASTHFFSTAPFDIILMILQKTNETPLGLNRLKLVNTTMLHKIERLYTLEQFRKTFPHYAWTKKDSLSNKFYPLAKNKNEPTELIFSRYQSILNQLLFQDDLSTKEKTARIQELNEFFFVDSGLVSSLNRKTKISNNLEINLSLAFVLHLGWCFAIDQAWQAFYWNGFYDHLEEDIEIEEKVENFTLPILSDYCSANVANVSIGGLLNKFKVILNENQADKLWRDLEYIVFKPAFLDFVESIGRNLRENFNIILPLHLNQTDFSTDQWKEDLNDLFILLAQFTFSEYLYATFLYLEVTLTDETLPSAVSELFRKNKLHMDHDYLNILVQPCRDYLNHYKNTTLRNDKELTFTDPLTEEIYSFSDLPYKPLIGIMCEVLSDR